MANIQITNIKLAGIDLFGDSESFLNQLSDDEIKAIIGGRLVPLRDKKGNIISYIEV